MKINKTIIIEFNGLPGTGKTTIVNELKKQLESEGYSVQKGYHYRLWQKYHYPIMIIPFSIKLYMIISRFADNIRPKRSRTHQTGILYYSRAYLNAQKHSGMDFLLIDQGIVQDIATIAWLDKIMPCNICDLELVIEKIREMGVSFCRVDCKNDIKLSLERIASRPKKNHEFETIDQKTLENALKIQASNFEVIRSLFDNMYKPQESVIVDTSLSPRENAYILKEFILKKI